MRWEKVNGIGEEGPGKRWGHTCNAVKGGRFLYLFGGYGKFNCQTNQVHVFDIVKQSWSQPVMKGLLPTARDSHSCAVIGDNLFVFGGTDGTNLLKDLQILDTNSHTWISPSVRGEGPEAREGHSAAVVGKRLFIFGGVGKSADKINEVYYNDLYMLNTETFVWTRATTSGTPPSPRDSHTCSSWKNKIIVIGGEDDRDDYLSDVHILDTDTLIWRELCTSGQLLPPRAGHSAVAFGKNLFVFGGFTKAQSLYNDLYMLDIDTGVWTKVITTPDGPSARFSVAGDCLDPFLGGVLVFIGGCNRSLEALDDMYYLYTGLARESEQRPEKLSLRKQLKLKCQEQNLNLVENPVLCGYEVGGDRTLSMTILNYSQPSRLNQSLHSPGKKTFQAKVIERKEAGYAIETVIDGKPLRGFLFSNKTNTLNPVANASSRKRTASEIDSVVSNAIHPSKVLKLDRLEGGGELQGVCSESHELHKEADATAISITTTTAAESIKVSVNQEPEAVSLNRNSDEISETPKSLVENLKNDGANDVTSSKGEVRTNDQTSLPISNYEVPKLAEHGQVSDAPNCNIDVQKSLAENLKNDGATDMTSSEGEVLINDQTNVPISNYEVSKLAEHGQVSNAPNYNTDLLKSLVKNLNNDGASDVTSSKDEVRTDDQTNVPISNYEVPRMAEHGQMSHAPNCDPDVLKPTVAKSVVSPSNQGETGDCTTPRTEGQSEPAKLT